MSEDDKTPVEPAIRRSSAKHTLGLVACPECNGGGHVKVADLDTVCTWCEGGRMVTHFTVAQWELSKGHLADSSNPPPPPSTERKP